MCNLKNSAVLHDHETIFFVLFLKLSFQIIHLKLIFLNGVSLFFSKWIVNSIYIIYWKVSQTFYNLITAASSLSKNSVYSCMSLPICFLITFLQIYITLCFYSFRIYLNTYECKSLLHSIFSVVLVISILGNLKFYTLIFEATFPVHKTPVRFLLEFI